MSNREQRKLWADHRKDEAAALQEQQVSAGAGHSPVEGPLPHSADDLAAAVASAVDAERRRCVAIAREWEEEEKLQAAFASFTRDEVLAAALLARAMADEIAQRPGAARA